MPAASPELWHDEAALSAVTVQWGATNLGCTAWEHVLDNIQHLHIWQREALYVHTNAATHVCVCVIFSSKDTLYYK